MLLYDPAGTDVPSNLGLASIETGHNCYLLRDTHHDQESCCCSYSHSQDVAQLMSLQKALQQHCARTESSTMAVT